MNSTMGNNNATEALQLAVPDGYCGETGAGADPYWVYDGASSTDADRRVIALCVAVNSAVGMAELSYRDLETGRTVPAPAGQESRTGFLSHARAREIIAAEQDLSRQNHSTRNRVAAAGRALAMSNALTWALVDPPF